MNLHESINSTEIAPRISIEPPLPKPGERIAVCLTLAEGQVQESCSLTAVIEEIDTRNAIISVPCPPVSDGATGLSFTCELPRDVATGFYRMVFIDENRQEIANQQFNIIDLLSEERFRFSELALEAVLQSAKIDVDQQPTLVANLLEMAAAYYEQAESFECAGHAFTDAALALEYAGEDNRAITLGWEAIRTLLLAEDEVGCAPLVTWLLTTSNSISEGVAKYIETGGLVLQQCEFGLDSERKKEVILAVAGAVLPSSARPDLSQTLKAMRGSERNDYVASTDELISLATSEIATYSRGVVFVGPRGVSLRCTTFIDEFHDSVSDRADALLAIAQ